MTGTFDPSAIPILGGYNLTANDAQSVQAILNQIKRSNRLEDRSEYSVQDLMQMYSLSEKDAKELERLIQEAMRRGDAVNDAEMRKWSIICKTIDGAGRQEIRAPITMIAATENEARAKAQKHWKGRGAISASIHSVENLG